MSDKLFGIHAQALALRAKRAEQLASNLANAETPNYKAQDLDFREVLGEQSGLRSTKLHQTSSGHMGAGSPSAAGFDNLTLKYRVPHQPSLDGNTVDEQIEKSEFASNSVRYMASLQFLEKRVQGLIKTLREE